MPVNQSVNEAQEDRILCAQRRASSEESTQIPGRMCLMDVTDELTDRYGDLPDEALELIRIAEIRALAEYVGAVHISKKERWIEITFSGKVKIHPYMFVMAKAEYGEELSITDARETVLRLHMGRTIDCEKLLGLMRQLAAYKRETQNMVQ